MMRKNSYETAILPVQTRKKSDIYLVAAWLTNGANLDLNVDTSDPRHVVFTVSGQDLDELEQLWVNGKLDGNLVRYAEKIRNLKSILHGRGNM